MYRILTAWAVVCPRGNCRYRRAVGRRKDRNSTRQTAVEEWWSENHGLCVAYGPIRLSTIRLGLPNLGIASTRALYYFSHGFHGVNYNNDNNDNVIRSDNIT